MLRLIVLFCCCASGTLHAEMIVKGATVRLLPPSVPNTAAYFSIENRTDTNQILVGVTADFATRAEIHNHVLIDGMMSMKHQPEVIVKADESLVFAPGGLHIMLFGLKQPLHEGQSVVFSLQTKKGESISVNANVALPSTHTNH